MTESGWRSARRWALFVVLLGLPLGGLSWDLPGSGPLRDFILETLRVPRLLVACLVGATLGTTGAAFQALFRNPLAAPSTVGTTAGATLGALVVVILPLPAPFIALGLTGLAFLGALGATMVITLIASRGRARMEEVLLGGIAVNLFAAAASQALESVADAPKIFAVAQWSLGSLPQVGYGRVLWLLVPALLCSGTLMLRARELAAVSVGESWAQSRGVAVRRLRIEVLAAAALGVGAAVALTGPIAFVGLIVPHLVRGTLATHPAHVIRWSALGGALFLASADAVAHFLIPGHELPVGVVTAAVGAPALLVLLVRRPRESR